MSRSDAENFPVALRFLRSDHRTDLEAVYGFARLVDDVGDEAPGDRTALLDLVGEELRAAFLGRAGHPVFVRLQPTIRRRALAPEPFEALLEANRRDQTVHRYATFEDLVGYCRLSADPVGHLVLAVFGSDTARNRRWSDAVCTGLQLAEHWQDVGEDAGRGRIYVPIEDLEAAGCREEDLLAGASPSPEVRLLMARLVGRTRAILDQGLPLLRSLRGRPRLAVAAYVGGGRAALAALAAAGYDSLSSSPRATHRARAAATASAVRDAFAPRSFGGGHADRRAP
jgi:squalene synthase HpnC